LKALAMRGRLPGRNVDKHEKSRGKQAICTSSTLCRFIETDILTYKGDDRDFLTKLVLETRSNPIAVAAGKG
jgi:hypothetical protein